MNDKKKPTTANEQNMSSKIMKSTIESIPNGTQQLRLIQTGQANISVPTHLLILSLIIFSFLHSHMNVRYNAAFN